jgi:phage virion morphogenesis protein
MAQFSVTFDDAQVQAGLARLSALVANPGPLLAILGERLVMSARERFDTNVSPDGAAWPALNPAYAEIRRPGPMLVQSGALRDSVHAEVAGSVVRVGSGMIYAAVHQFGAVIRPTQARALAFRMGANNGLFLLQKVRIPARPYLGISATDEAAIIEDAQAFMMRVLGG